MKIIIADDDKNLRKVLANELFEEGFNVAEADDGIKAVGLIEKNGYDVLLLDLNMPGLGGLDVLEKIKELEIPVEVIILTAHATVSTAVEAMKMGAYDCLTKPFKIEELKIIIEKAYEKKRLLRENILLKSQIKRQSESKDIITESPCMLSLLETVKKIAVSGLPVLIYGESGVGKELIAKSIHNSSNKADGPFIPINCGAIPETMLETELFGHEKGAFTGAHAKKLGLIEILSSHGIHISMDGKGRWTDNVFVEQLWRSVKYEDVYLKAYDSISAARHGLKEYFDFYNRMCRHQSLDNRTPYKVYCTTLPKQQVAA